MATNTPYFNLSKPADGDKMSDTVQAYRDNLDIIDANLGGGGSGGHTIIDPNGNSLPQEGGLQFTGSVSVTDDNGNGRTVVNIGGGGSLNIGVYVDPTQIIASGTWNTSFSYTATTDCFVFLDGDLDNSHYVVYIDGVKIFDLGSAMYTEHMSLFPLRKGQVMTATKATTYALNYVVYGTLQGTNGIFAPVIYSDVERVIGVWRDNKPLYQKTIPFGVLPNTTTKSVAHGINNLEYVANVVCTSSNGSERINVPFVNDNNVNSQLMLYITSANIVISAGLNRSDFTTTYCTIWYTKTTDVAGSGNWNTDGVPTHHYSTSEQVIGTWINGKPLYECTLTLGALPNNAIKTVPHGIANVDLIFVSDSFFQTGAGASSYLNFTNDTTAGQIEILVNKNDVEIWAGTDRTSWNGYATVRYTKTTD